MGFRILIVDNDPRIRELVRDILTDERADSQIEMASSASEALKLFLRQPVDLLITDWQMPHMDGLALIETVQLFYPGTQAILTTSADPDEIQERSRGRGLSFKLFIKPFALAPFLSYVDQALAKKAARLPVDALNEKKGRANGHGCWTQPSLNPAQI